MCYKKSLFILLILFLIEANYSVLEAFLASHLGICPF